MLNKEIGTALQELRKGKSLSMDVVANQIGHTKGWLSLIENNKRPISSLDLMKLCAVYGYNIAFVPIAEPLTPI